MLAVLSYAAQLERDMMLQRQAESIAAAKVRGVQFARLKKELPQDFAERYPAWRSGRLTGEEMASRCDMALGIIYRKVRKIRENGTWIE